MTSPEQRPARVRRAPSARAVRQAIARRRIGQPVSERRRSNVRFAALVVALLGGGVCLLLALNTSAAANEVRERDLASSVDSLSAQAQDLRRQIAEREAPGSLAAAAAALGMVPGKAPAFLVLGPDGTVTVLGDPQPAPLPPAPLPPAPAPAETPSPDPSATSAPADPVDPAAPAPTTAPTGPADPTAPTGPVDPTAPASTADPAAPSPDPAQTSASTETSQ